MNLKIFLTINSCLMVRGTSVRGAQAHPISRRNLDEAYYIPGHCTLLNFEGVVGVDALVDLLNVGNDRGAMQLELDERCNTALEPTIDLSVTLEKGPQFLKNFIDGGTTWNDNYGAEEDNSYYGAQEDMSLYDLGTDAAIVPSLYGDSQTTVFGAPDGGTGAYYDRYFSNFFSGEEECQLGVIECCYTSSRISGQGYMGGLVGNAEMCALDMTGAKQSNHISSRSYTYFDTKDTDDTYCSGFAYEKGSFADKVKYNTFFHMAMTTNLFEKGYVKNIPGAPLCGCVEQMPIIDNAACVMVNEGYDMDTNGNVSIHIGWEECGTDLASFYEDGLDGRSEVEKYFVRSKIVGADNCAAASLSFMNDQMLVPTTTRR